MTTEATDTTLVSLTGSVADTLSQQGYSIGRIIPLYDSVPATVMQVFTGKEEQADYFSLSSRAAGLERTHEIMNGDFSFALLSVSLLLLTVLTVFGRKSLSSFISSLGFRHISDTSLPGSQTLISWQPVVRNIFSIINISLFAAIALLYTKGLSYSDQTGPVKLTGIIAVSFLAALLLRHLTCIAVAGITGWKSIFREYMQIIYNAWFADALILFLLGAIILFSPVNNSVVPIIAGIVLTSIFLILRALRLILIFLSSRVSIFYFILYLCALEILPVLVMLKLFGVL